MSLRTEILLDSRRFWSIFYLHNSTYSRIPFHCITITYEGTQWRNIAVWRNYDVISPL